MSAWKLATIPRALVSFGRGEQRVLLAEPYKSELLPHWRFRTPAIARESAATIYARFLSYRDRTARHRSSCRARCLGFVASAACLAYLPTAIRLTRVPQ